VEFRGFPELHAPFPKERRTRGPVQSCIQEIRGISLAFREMWDSTALAPRPHNNWICSLGDLGFPANWFYRNTRSQKRDLGHPLKVAGSQLVYLMVRVSCGSVGGTVVSEPVEDCASTVTA
jgi:hypothetical protein